MPCYVGNETHTVSLNSIVPDAWGVGCWGYKDVLYQMCVCRLEGGEGQNGDLPPLERL